MDTVLASVLIGLAVVMRTAHCQVLYEKSHVSGGSLMPSYNEVDKCLEACKASITCRAVDFNFGDNTCWFHYDNTICNMVKKKTNCNHYEFITCAKGQHAIGGKPQDGIIDVTSCINACVDPCKAVDFNSVDNTCWFHEVDTACLPLRTKQGCRHYGRIDCKMLPSTPMPDNTPVLQSFPGEHALGGERQTDISSAFLCIQLCHVHGLCNAVDFDFSDDSCWFHYEKTSCTALMDRPSVTHYRLTSCSRAVPTQEFPGFHIKGGSPVSGFSDVTSCVYACSLDSKCRAIDFNAEDNSCWFHNAATACKSPEPKQNCIHMKLFMCAPDVEPFEVPQPMAAPSAALMPQPMLRPPPPMPKPVPNPAPSTIDGQCGMPAISPQTKIVGGREAVQHSWPWQATLLRGTASTGVTLVCGGSLISPQYLITAAHCLQNNTNPTRWLVTLGDHDLSIVESSQITSEVLSIVIHAGFNPNTLINDIALVKLAQPVKYTAEVSPICLPSLGLVFPVGMLCMVTGWGDTRGTPDAIRLRLNQASVPIFIQSSCNNSYSGAITDNMICAGVPEGGRDSCSGDSGGPLACKLPDQRWYLAGIVSFGNDCALPNFPGVYTRVTKYISWITVNMM